MLANALAVKALTIDVTDGDVVGKTEQKNQILARAKSIAETIANGDRGTGQNTQAINKAKTRPEKKFK